MKKLPKIPPEYLILGVGALVALGFLYWVTKKAVAEVGGAVFGASAAQNSHDVDGNDVTAYQGLGAIGTLAAGTNDILGGIPASIGEKIADWFSPSYDPNAPTTTVRNPSRKQAVGDNFYDQRTFQ